MTELALIVPDPRTEMVPPGWYLEHARPILSDAETWSDIQEKRAKIEAAAGYIEALGGDITEFMKARRLIDAREGKALGDAERGGDRRSPDFQVRQDEPEIQYGKAARAAKRRIWEWWDVFLDEYVMDTNNPRALTQRHCLKLIDERNPVDKELPDVGDESGPGWSMMFGDMRERLYEIPDGSIDLIFTDPPYPKDYLHLYGDLADHAARLLKPRGVLITYAGLLFLPDVIDYLRRPKDDEGQPTLSYGWTFSLAMEEGSQSRIMGRHIIQGWKPLIVMTKGKWTSGEWMNDPIRHDRHKDKYGWQQDAAAAQTVIERFTRPNEIVLDPFMGTGTTAEATLAAKRQSIGVEADESRFAMAVERIRG